MKGRTLFVAQRCVLALALCASLAVAGCTGDQIHKVKVANADLTSALSATSKTLTDLANQGTITAAEKTAIAPRIIDAAILANKIEDCTNAVTAANTLRGCVTPLITAVKNDIDPASIGVKNANAQAILTSVLAGAALAIETIVSVGGN